MTIAAPQESKFDYTVQDLGNIVELGHLNVCISDQRLATVFYITGLGLTRDPYMRTGIENMWVNVGRGQLHLPSRAVQVLRGVTGLVVPDLAALWARLEEVKPLLAETRFSFKEVGDTIEAVCPWGNRFRCHAPDLARYGPFILGMAYVEIDVPQGAVEAISAFYREVLTARTGVATDARGPYAWVTAGKEGKLIFRETDTDPRPYDGHHIQITLADFSGPYRKLRELGLITQEDDKHQYRFQDVVDLRDGRVLCTIEHEMRSMRHPHFGRLLINRNIAQTGVEYAPGQDAGNWSMVQSTPPPPK